MNETQLNADPRFPVGKFVWPVAVSAEDRARYIDTIAAAPARLRAAVAGLSEEQLDTPYRDGGWTVRQVIHHVPESHMNSYIRFKLALTEDEPVIKPYDEAAWAELPDNAETPIEVAPSVEPAQGPDAIETVAAETTEPGITLPEAPATVPE